MKFLTRRKTIIKELSTELAYLQIRADYWYYINKNQEMSSSILEYVTELKEIANRFGVLKSVYDSAYQIYNFRNGGKKEYNPDIELLKKLDKEFCEPRKRTRVFA